MLVLHHLNIIALLLNIEGRPGRRQLLIKRSHLIFIHNAIERARALLKLLKDLTNLVLQALALANLKLAPNALGVHLLHWLIV